MKNVALKCSPWVLVLCPENWKVKKTYLRFQCSPSLHIFHLPGKWCKQHIWTNKLQIWIPSRDSVHWTVPVWRQFIFDARKEILKFWLPPSPGFYPSTFLQPLNGSKNSILNWVLKTNLFKCFFLCLSKKTLDRFIILHHCFYSISLKYLQTNRLN